MHEHSQCLHSSSTKFQMCELVCTLIYVQKLLHPSLSRCGTRGKSISMMNSN
jgi:hypothetical protein